MGLIMKNGIQYPGVGSGEGSGLEISQLDDVKITTPLTDKESLVYNKEIGKWENKKISSENSLPYNLILSEKWDNNISGGASENTVWTSKIFLTKGTYSIYDYVSWQSSMRIYYTYYFIEMSDDFEGCFHGSQRNSQINVSSDTQGWACFTTNEQTTIIKGTAKIQLKFWGSSGPAYDGGGTVSLYKIDGLNNSSGISELPIASAETLGGIKVGENLEITKDGTLNTKISSGSHNYSTEERVVGTWIDGKPIYEKVIAFSLTGSGNLSYAHNIENLHEIHFISMLHGNSENRIKTCRTYVPWYNEASVYLDEITTTDISIYHNSNRTEFYEFILRYTKTTD